MIHANDNGKPITFISMFSGIEAASVAFGPLGWKAVCFAEIEKFPSAVLAHHYPDVPNVGDMSKHDWAQYRGKVDIVCGGPPCQDFSIAGLRAGLDGERGNLSIVYMRALHAIKPRNAIVENVPGWLNDKKNAFGCFLAGLVGADDPLRTPDGKSWPNAGMVAGPLGRAAWRVLDAQYFGLAQRRRRVIVVADFGNGADPAAVLFERKGLFGNTPPSREAGKDVAPTISARTKGGGGLGTDFDLDGGLRVETFDRQSNCEYGEADIASTVSARDYKSPTDLVAHAIQAGALRTNPNSGPDGVGVQEGVAYTLEARAEVQAVCVTGDVAHTLKAEGADASEDGTGRGTPIVAFSAKDYGADAQFDVAPTLRAGGHSGSHQNGRVMPAVAFAENSRAEVRLEGGDGQTVGCIGAGGGKPGQGYPAVLTSAVRRLTPVECERPQGFPDFYTRIPVRHYKVKKVTRTRPEDMWEFIDGEWWLMAADGPRYKALGNSWAVPKFVWLGKRIQQFMPALASVANDNQETPIANASINDAA